MSQGTDRENAQTHFDTSSDYVQDDSQKDGKRRAMRRAQQNKVGAILIAFIVVTIVACITVGIIKGGDTKETGATEVLTEQEPSGGDSSEVDSSTTETSAITSSDADTSETQSEESEVHSETESETEVPTEPVTEPETVPPTTEPVTEPTVSTTVEPTSRAFPAYKELVPGLTQNPQYNVNNGAAINIPSWIVQDLLTVNTATKLNGRPGTKLSSVKHIVIHYVGNTLSSAKDNRDYFQYQTDNRNVSSHFVVGLYGEIIQCVPINEKAHAQGGTKNVGGIDHNTDSISIETCHFNDAGQFTDATYQSLVKLVSYLLQQYGLPAHGYSVDENGVAQGTIWLHWHCSGKACPKYWVADMNRYFQFVYDVQDYMAAHPNIQ